MKRTLFLLLFLSILWGCNDSNSDTDTESNADTNDGPPSLGSDDRAIADPPNRSDSDHSGRNFYTALNGKGNVQA